MLAKCRFGRNVILDEMSCWDEMSINCYSLADQGYSRLDLTTLIALYLAHNRLQVCSLVEPG